jgi:hypothetical protein
MCPCVNKLLLVVTQPYALHTLEGIKMESLTYLHGLPLPNKLHYCDRADGREPVLLKPRPELFGCDCRCGRDVTEERPAAHLNIFVDMPLAEQVRSIRKLSSESVN